MLFGQMVGYVLWPGPYGRREVELVGGGRQREQRVPFSKEVESRSEFVGSISGRLGRASSAVIIHYYLMSVS